MMHIATLVVGGVAALAVFFFVARIAGRSGSAGARIFIWAWLAVALINAAFGVIAVGIPVINEIAAFVPIFGIPAGAAWYLSRRDAGAA